MRNLMILSLLALFTMSCSNVGKFSGAIESLGTDWDSATEMITGLAANISTEQNNLTGMLANMEIGDEIKNKLSEEALGQITQLTSQFTGQQTALSGVSQEVLGFISNWEEKGKMLTSLKEGLSAGKLSGDPQAQIDELTALVAEGKEKVGGWEGKVADISGQAKSISDQVAGILAAVN